MWEDLKNSVVFYIQLWKITRQINVESKKIKSGKKEKI